MDTKPPRNASPLELLAFCRQQLEHLRQGEGRPEEREAAVRVVEREVKRLQGVLALRRRCER